MINVDKMTKVFVEKFFL